eukprot:CAMPEP_0171983052 /NCGR_PEP_ID=MMETSP0993-20121228/273085_1 /TAXON_ID=483369 /ORGANISM="non described non described, Strain CCMP2098" /LENGTH=175 /DNA_ID=CAMNT_0012635775 /DNA_START=52 /DNA_END=579 /DNA_ORIENTATION=-
MTSHLLLSPPASASSVSVLAQEILPKSGARRRAPKSRVRGAMIMIPTANHARGSTARYQHKDLLRIEGSVSELVYAESHSEPPLPFCPLILPRSGARRRAPKSRVRGATIMIPTAEHARGSTAQYQHKILLRIEDSVLEMVHAELHSEPPLEGGIASLCSPPPLLPLSLGGPVVL